MVGILIFPACGNDKDIKNEEKPATQETESVKKENKSADVEDISVSSNDELEELITKDIDDSVSSLKSEFTTLTAEIATYDEYKSKLNDVESFYEKIENETNNMCLRLRQYAIEYAEMILASDIDNDDKYDELELIYEVIYEDAREEVYDEIYDGIMEDMYDRYYDGILSDAYDNDNIDYGEVSDLSSDEYDLWSDAHSEIYDIYSDAGSDIYGFYSDLKSEIYDDDVEKANEIIAEFKEDVAKLLQEL
ncbi:MAG: hypothetical protein E7415_04885 [Ruminococcaceae bacterium]|nr:hypothetical protein [Oscillospiraceae bacterium]